MEPEYSTRKIDQMYDLICSVVKREKEKSLHGQARCFSYELIPFKAFKILQSRCHKNGYTITMRIENGKNDSYSVIDISF